MIVNKTSNSLNSPQPVALPHMLAAEEVAARLDIRPDFGLTDAEAKRRNTQYGPNRLPEAQPRSAWLVFFGQFKSILISELHFDRRWGGLQGSVRWWWFTESAELHSLY